MHTVEKEGKKLLRILLAVARELGSEAGECLLELAGSDRRARAGPKALNELTERLGDLTAHAERVVAVQLVLVDAGCEGEAPRGGQHLSCDDEETLRTDEVLLKLLRVAHALQSRVHEAGAVGKHEVNHGSGNDALRRDSLSEVLQASQASLASRTTGSLTPRQRAKHAPHAAAAVARRSDGSTLGCGVLPTLVLILGRESVGVGLVVVR